MTSSAAASAASDALADRALRFHALHTDGQVLALPNAWDAASARVIEEAGATAIATTSSGVAWGLGAADGEHLDRRLAVELVARVAAAVSVPVTADIEGGFAPDAGGVAETVRAVLTAGAVGVNLEDSLVGGPEPLRSAKEQAERLAAARAAADEAGVPLFINARVDTYLRGVGAEGDRFEATLERAEAYADAGADGIFVPGVTDLATISALSHELTLPLNVLAGPGAPSVPELAAAGAVRVSVGGAIAASAYALARRAATELLGPGTYGAVGEGIAYGEFNALFTGRAGS